MKTHRLAAAPHPRHGPELTAGLVNDREALDFLHHQTALGHRERQGFFSVDDLAATQSFYNAREAGVGNYCVTSQLADIESLALYRGIQSRQYGCFRVLANRFPFGIYYLETENETRVVAGLDLRCEPG